MSQKIPYCGGEAYLVDQVLLPCGDISAVMGEIANIPSPCRNNVEGVLNKNSLSYFNALLLATGVQRPVFASGGGQVTVGVPQLGSGELSWGQMARRPSERQGPGSYMSALQLTGLACNPVAVTATSSDGQLLGLC